MKIPKKLQNEKIVISPPQVLTNTKKMFHVVV